MRQEGREEEEKEVAEQVNKIKREIGWWEETAGGKKGWREREGGAG